MSIKQKSYRDGEPCEHKGCLHHISHPCEGCGRIGGRSAVMNIKQVAREYVEKLEGTVSDETWERYLEWAAGDNSSCDGCHQDCTAMYFAFLAGARAVLDAARGNASIPEKKSKILVVLLASLEAFVEGEK